MRIGSALKRKKFAEECNANVTLGAVEEYWFSYEGTSEIVLVRGRIQFLLSTKNRDCEIKNLFFPRKDFQIT